METTVHSLSVHVCVRVRVRVRVRVHLFVCVCICLFARLVSRFCMFLWWAVFVCLSVRLSPLEQQGADPPPSYLVPPRPAKPSLGCAADIGTPDAFILPTTNTPRY